MDWISHVLVVVAAILIWWEHRLKYEFVDRRTTANKKWRGRVFWLTLIILFFTEIDSLYKDHKAKSDKHELYGHIDALTNQLATITAENLKLRENVTQGFQDISREFSTNSTIDSATRLAVFNNIQNNLSDEQKQIQQSHELFNTEATDLKTLRAERENELALQENKKKQEAIRQAKDDIKNSTDEDAINQFRKLQQQEILRSKKILAKQILPIFNQVVVDLNKMLGDFSLQTGESLKSDLSGARPTVYASDLVKDGIIVEGTNHISIGTNLAWNFEISTVVKPVLPAPIWAPASFLKYQDYRLAVFNDPYACIKIESRTTNGTSTLTIAPYRVRNLDLPDHPPPESPAPDKPFYSQISIKLRIPNGLDFDDLQPWTNCTGAIDKVLRRLVEAEDQQYPLTSKTSN